MKITKNHVILFSGMLQLILLIVADAQTQSFSENKCTSGEVFSHSQFSDPYSAVHAFDNIVGDNDNNWCSLPFPNQQDFWIAYKFSLPEKINKVRIYPRPAYSTLNFQNFSIEGSNNSTNGNDGNWVSLQNNLSMLNLEGWNDFVFENQNPYLTYRIKGKGNLYGGAYTVNVSEIQMMSSEGGAAPSQLCQSFYCDGEGNVSIGTPLSATGYRLSVQGKIMAEGVKVELQSKWPDYVFDNAYPLKPLKEVGEYIRINNHLPEMPSAGEVKSGGLDLAEINIKLLQKIEELTLYQLELLEKQLELMRKVEKLENKIASMTER
jgi:hypothetical protein